MSRLNQRLVLPLLALPLLIMLASCDKSPSSSAQDSLKENPQKNIAEKASELTSGIRLDFLDTTVDPKQDFFRYANGNWLNNTEIPEDKARYGAFTLLGDKARDDVKAIIQQAEKNPTAKNKGSEAQQIGDFYTSFMNTERADELGTTPIEGVLSSIEKIKTYKQL